jgi:hypothetical protein
MLVNRPAAAHTSMFLYLIFFSENNFYVVREPTIVYEQTMKLRKNEITKKRFRLETMCRVLSLSALDFMLQSRGVN